MKPKTKTTRWSEKRKQTMGMVLYRASRDISLAIDGAIEGDNCADYKNDLRAIADLANFLEVKYGVVSNPYTMECLRSVYRVEESEA